MAKVVCKNCGQKNPSSAAVCVNCGSFMFEDPKPAAAPATNTNSVQEMPQEDNMQETAAMASSPQSDYNAPTQPPVEIKVSGSAALQQLSTLSGFAILAIFFGLEYSGYFTNTYYFFVFLALIFVVPTLLRRAGSVIKFVGPDFAFRNSTSSESYPLTEIENIKIDHYDRLDQLLTINFGMNRPPLQVEFNSIVTFRSVIVAFSRRRIPIIPAGSPQQ